MIYQFCQNRHFLQFLQFQNTNALFIVPDRIKIGVESLLQEGSIVENNILKSTKIYTFGISKYFL